MSFYFLPVFFFLSYFLTNTFLDTSLIHKNNYDETPLSDESHAAAQSDSRLTMRCAPSARRAHRGRYRRALEIDQKSLEQGLYFGHWVMGVINNWGNLHPHSAVL